MAFSVGLGWRNNNSPATRPELVFVLQQEVALHEAYRQRITECDQQIEKHLATFADNSNAAAIAERRNQEEEKKADAKCSGVWSQARNSSASRE
jgi:hypothetical protein